MSQCKHGKNGVIVLNYNSFKLTCALVEQICCYEDIDEICVVDNNSCDDFSGIFNSTKVHYIKNKENLGYNAGNNVGIKYLVNECRCDYIYIANPDVDFENSAIHDMSSAMEKNEKLVLVATKRYGYGGVPLHQYFDFPTYQDSIKNCFFLGRRNYQKNKHFEQNKAVDEADWVLFVDAVPGAFFGIKSSFLQEIGYLYEGIFLYGEEIIIGRQAHDKGYKAGIVNSSCYYHNHIQQKLSKSNKKMFLYDRLSLIKYFEYFNLLSKKQIHKLKLAVRVGSIEYNFIFLLAGLLRKGNQQQKSNHKKCSHEAANYIPNGKFNNVVKITSSQAHYIEYIAEGNYERFLRIGHAVAGHNGPHGHMDSPVRNTANYLIIYSFLFKKSHNPKYRKICDKFSDYLISEESKSLSGAIKCMESDQFDHLNGLIGQGWVIDALIYYYEVFENEDALATAYKICKSQKYNWNLHLWERVELDGTNIGVDITYNHQVWFAACISKLVKYCADSEIDAEIRDFIKNGTGRDFYIYSDGILRHIVGLNTEVMKGEKRKRLIKRCLWPLKRVNPRKLDPKYIERAYHIFDVYGFTMLKEYYGDMEFFGSNKYLKAVKTALDINNYNNGNDVSKYLSHKGPFNVFGYSYNSPAFEYPYVALMNGKKDDKTISYLFDIQKKLMLDESSGLFEKNNPDIETWNAKTYEIIRYLDKRMEY